MARAVTVVGWVLLLGGVGLILLGLVGVAMRDGIWAAVQMLNPFTNTVNTIAMMITLAPGVLLITWGDKLREKKRQTVSG